MKTIRFLALLKRVRWNRMTETEKKYSIIYADPPWRYDRKRGSGVAENHYPTMSMEEIAELPIDRIAHKNSILFLWATFPQLDIAIEVIRAWNFCYKTVGFVWLKQTRVSHQWFFGMGNWTRSNAEICLLATRGKPKRLSASVHQFIISPVQSHSQKPEAAREKIVELMGDLPRIELFARKKTDGWDVWGNEVKCDIDMEKIRGGGVCDGFR